METRGRTQSPTLFLFAVFGILLLLSSEADARRRRRDTSINAKLAAINSEFHLLDSPPLQRLVRQVSDKDQLEAEEAEEEEDEQIEREIAATRGPNAPPPPSTVQTTPKTPLNQSPTPNPSGGALLRSPPNSPQSSPSGPTNRTQPGSPPPPVNRPQGPPSPPPQPTSPIQINQGEIYLPAGYNRLEIPKIRIGRAVLPVPVIVYLNIRSVREYDELEESITLEMDLIVEWFDGVLFDITKVNPKVAPIQKTLNPVFLKKIWTPDIYMDDLISVAQPSFMAKPLTLKFSPNTGFISYTSRIATTANCDMFFHHYPADTQTCEFKLRSYSFYSSDLELNWLLHGVYLQDPAEANFDIQVSSIETIKTTQPFNNPRNETHDTLVFTILARRKLSYHLVQTFLPSIFFIIITWLCFLIPSKFIEARIGISMTTLLTLTAMFASVRESTPIVSYVKAIDLWMVFCIFFVFLTLLEFSILIWMRAIREEAVEKENASIEDKNQDLPRRKSLSDTISHHSTTSSTLRAHGLFSELVEKYAFVIFSIIFIAFNIIYWTWLLQSAKYFDWSVNGTHTALDDDD